MDLNPRRRSAERSEATVFLRFKSRLGRFLRRTSRRAPRAIASVCSALRESGNNPAGFEPCRSRAANEVSEHVLDVVLVEDRVLRNQVVLAYVYHV